jgi:hypothetical protein
MMLPEIFVLLKIITSYGFDVIVHFIVGVA